MQIEEAIERIAAIREDVVPRSRDYFALSAGISALHYVPQQPHGYWMQTDETVWDAKEVDGKQCMTISIVAAKCSVCKRWAEQVNQFPPYMHYDRCPHCGAIMDAKPPKNKPEVET